ncbi:hypothetical protein AQJ30_32050 [Streptomyces longwoodensis]|uniref:Uncharacterized protein n=1 Tax=Streptomyces longwoodensis TaxID=68231 RepID=A0A117QKU8_9ACTN|nr:hypothetical protein AQJ30_32050 [Streptomyces longwoodensis]
MGPAVDLRAGDAGEDCGCFDGVREQFGRGPGRGWGVAAFRAVEADDRVEMDGAPLLVLGDLGEGDPGVVPECPLGEAGSLGDLPAEVDREPSP